jgi:hypothetical protein
MNQKILFFIFLMSSPIFAENANQKTDQSVKAEMAQK